MGGTKIGVQSRAQRELKSSRKDRTEALSRVTEGSGLGVHFGTNRT